MGITRRNQLKSKKNHGINCYKYINYPEKVNVMIDNYEIEKIIEERKKLHPDDSRVVEKWKELTQIFIQNEENTIAYLNSCCKENIYWISEIFEDISEQLQSSGFIECIERLAIKYPDLNLEQDVLYAKKVLNTGTPEMSYKSF